MTKSSSESPRHTSDEPFKISAALSDRCLQVYFLDRLRSGNSLSYSAGRESLRIVFCTSLVFAFSGRRKFPCAGFRLQISIVDGGGRIGNYVNYRAVT